jgi:hypothetical protein
MAKTTLCEVKRQSVRRSDNSNVNFVGTGDTQGNRIRFWQINRGIGEKAAQLSIDHIRRKKTAKPYMPSLIGEMNNDLVAAEIQLNDMLGVMAWSGRPPAPASVARRLRNGRDAPGGAG